MIDNRGNPIANSNFVATHLATKPVETLFTEQAFTFGTHAFAETGNQALVKSSTTALESQAARGSVGSLAKGILKLGGVVFFILTNPVDVGGPPPYNGPPDPPKERDPRDPNGLWRGGNNLLNRIEVSVKFDRNGMVRPGYGASVYSTKSKVLNHGIPHRVVSVPAQLQVHLRGGKPDHFEISPREAMPFNTYKSLLRQVVLVPDP